MSRNDPRNGVVLVAVLWTIALLSALAMAASTSFREFAGVVAVDRDRVRADALLSAGVETAAAAVARLGDRPLTLRETVVALPQGSVRLRLSDETGRIDINKAPVKLLVALLHAAGAGDSAEKLAGAIDAWRQQDLARQGGGTQAAAAPVPPAAPFPAAGQVPAQAPGTADPGGKKSDAVMSFLDVRELLQVPGMLPAYVGAMRPLATVFGDDKVNGLTATPEVLAILPGMNTGRVATFLETRQRGAATHDLLQQILGAANDVVGFDAGPVVRVDLAARLLDGYTAAASVIIVVLPQDSRPYRVLAWTPLRPAGRDMVARDSADFGEGS